MVYKILNVHDHVSWWDRWVKKRSPKPHITEDTFHAWMLTHFQGTLHLPRHEITITPFIPITQGYHAIVTITSHDSEDRPFTTELWFFPTIHRIVATAHPEGYLLLHDILNHYFHSMFCNLHITHPSPYRNEVWQWMHSMQTITHLQLLGETIQVFDDPHHIDIANRFREDALCVDEVDGSIYDHRVTYTHRFFEVDNHPIAPDAMFNAIHLFPFLINDKMD